MMMQDETEINAFRDLLKQEGVTSYLEIGSKFGGSLARVAQILPNMAKVVSVDLPHGTKAWNESERALRRVVWGLIGRGIDARIIWGDSTAPNVIKQVARAGPFDAVLIDANHTMPYLRKDWANYAPLGRIIAFHDLSWRREPEWQGVRIDVPEFWEEVKGDYRHVEFRYCRTGKNNGIGVLWRL